MSEILGILLTDSETRFSSKLLLDKPCHQYVMDAMLAAGASASAFTQDELAPDAEDTVVFAAQHTPCIGDLSGLVQAAQDTPAALVTRQGTPLAIALPAGQLSSFSDPLTMDFLLEQYTDTIQLLPLQDEADAIAVTDAESYSTAYNCLRTRIVKQHMQNGVIILDPDRTILSSDVQIGSGTTIYPGNTLEGKTTIGEDCTLYPGNRMLNATVGDETTIENSVLLHCSVGSHTTVGPFAYLRPKAAVGNHCRIGDFVEIKNSNIGDETKVSHLTYVGDGDLGQHINLGCGVVFSNYDGKLKHRTVVEDNAFIGCNVNLVPPVHIGKDTYIAAGSTVTQDVPDDALFIARVRGEIKEGWVSRRKEKGKL